MKRLKRFIIYTLITLFVSPLNLLQAYAASPSNPKNIQEASNQRVELTDQRTQFSKTFQLSSGKKELVAYQKPIHYQANESGTTAWKDIDSNINTITTRSTTGNKQYTNKANDFSVKFSDNLSDDGVQITKGNNTLKFLAKSASISPSVQNSYAPYNWLSLNNQSQYLTYPYLSIAPLPYLFSAYSLSPTSFYNGSYVNTPSSINFSSVKPIIENNKASYKEIVKGTDINYYSVEDGLKEEIVINKYYGQNTFSFDLNVSNVYFEKQKDGGYVFYDKTTKQPVFSMPKLYMWDSKGGKGSIDNEYSFDIDTNIIKKGNSWELVFTASNKWLSDKSRVFPVTIDPSIDVYIHYTEDTYVQEGYPTYNMWVNRDMYVGRGATKKRTRALIPFSYDNLTNARISSAAVYLYQFYCAGSCTWSPIQAELTRDYDFKTVTWNTQPEMLGIVGETNNGTSDGWVGIDVTTAARHWYNDGNPSGSKVGSFMFVQGDESSWGYRQLVAESHPDAWAQDKKPHFVIQYNDYNVQYSITSIPDVQVLSKVTPTVVVKNTGRNNWGKSDTKLGYHLVNNSTGQKWDNWFELPGDVCAGGCSTTVTPTFSVPDSPGNYTIKWDMIQPGNTWFSDQGLSTANDDFVVKDFPEYSAEYGGGTISSIIAGTTAKIPVEVTNRSRNDWTATTYGIGYHWDNATSNETVIRDGIITAIPNTISRREGFGTILADVKAPVNSGNYILRFDMYRLSNSQWFSDNGVTPLSKNVVVAPPSFSSMTHLGTEDYYTKAGPIDLATGNVSFSVSDMSINSNTGGLNITRSYNSKFMDETFTSDSNGYIRSWLFNGPYRENDKNQRLTKPFIANENNVRPSEGSTSNGNLWFKETEPSTSQMWLNKAFWSGYAYQQDMAKNCSGYAFVYVYSPADKTVKLKLGSDDGIKVWLNGDNIFSNDTERSLSLDSDNITTKLNQGWNSLLVKISQSNNDWQMSARFTNTDDSLIGDLKYSLNNPEVFTTNRSFGYGWTANFDESLSIIDSDSIYYRDSTGTVNIYTKKADGTYQRPNGSVIDLTRNTDNTYYLTEKSGVKTYFRSDGKISYKIDLSGNRLNYEYDSSGKCVKMTDGTRYVTISYDASGRVSQIVNPQSEKTTYLYLTQDGKTFLDTITDNIGNSSNYQYYGVIRPTTSSHYSPLEPNLSGYRVQLFGKMISSINKRGYKTKIGYSDDEKVTEIVDAIGNDSRFVYNGRVVTATDPLSRKSTAEFSENNVLISFANAKGYKEIFQVDGNYNIAAITPAIDQNSNYFFRWAYQYDNYSNPLSETDPIDRKQSFEYQSNDLKKLTDGTANVTEYNYSADGRRLLTSIKDPKNNSQSYSYDSSGRVTESIDPKGAKTKSTYSAEGDKLTLTSPKNEKTSFSYDKSGRLITNTTSLGTVNYFAYDPSGRLSSIKDPAGLEIKNQYDENGNVLKVTDPKGGYKTYQYDPLDRVTKITDETGANISYVYDAVGNKTQTIDANGKTTSYKYNEIDQITEITDPSGGVTKFEYNTVNNISKITKPNGNAISLTQNKAGDTTAVNKPEGSTNIGYDSSGKVTAVNTGSETNAITYDKNSNIASINSSNGNTAISYDQANQQTTTSLNTNTINYSYDANGQITEISSKINQTGQAISNTFIRDTEGKISSIKKGNSDTSMFFYDNSSRVSSIVNRNKSKVLQSGYNYQYDANSNATAIYEDRTKELIKYSYDARNQLIQENNTSYTYDPMGNRIKMTNGGNSVNYYYDTAGDSNRLLKYSAAGGKEVSFDYDKNGNIVKQTSSTGITQYFYDSDDYFIKAILPDGSTVEYIYDKLFKHRIQRIETSSTGTKDIVNYNWDEDRLVSEADSSGKIIRSYTWDENESLCSITVSDSSGDLQTYYYIKDGKGNILGMSDVNGNEVVKYGYDAWGNITKSSTISSSVPANLDKLNPRLYSGYWYDAKLGLYVMRARMYNPTVGRFMSADPMQVGTDALDGNPYIYCGNNPITRIDPSGKFLFLVPLIYYAIIATPVIVAGLYMLVNTPALVASIDQDIRIASDKTKSTAERIIAGFGATTTLIPGGAGVKGGSKAISQSAKSVKLASSTVGKIGEKNVGQALNIEKNTAKIILRSNGNRRIFDFIDEDAKIYYEVKNVRYLAWTKQLDDMYNIAKQQGFTFKLYVRDGINNVSQKVKDMVGPENILEIPNL